MKVSLPLLLLTPKVPRPISYQKPLETTMFVALAQENKNKNIFFRIEPWDLVLNLFKIMNPISYFFNKMLKLPEKQDCP